MNEKTISGRCFTVLTDFSGLVGQKFALRAGTEPALEVELESAAGLPSGGAVAREPFSLIFRGPAQPRLAQGTYGIEHPALGCMEMFLVPVALDARGLRLQAVFN